MQCLCHHCAHAIRCLRHHCRPLSSKMPDLCRQSLLATCSTASALPWRSPTLLWSAQGSRVGGRHRESRPVLLQGRPGAGTYWAWLTGGRGDRVATGIRIDQLNARHYCARLQPTVRTNKLENACVKNGLDWLSTLFRLRVLQSDSTDY